MPVNFAFIGWMLTLFPEAKIIHCKRHPLDVCLSNFFTSYTSGNSFSYDLNHIAMYIKVYEPLMRYWYSIFNDKIFTVYYENFISNSEQIGKRLVDWLDLTWNNRFLDHHKNKNIVLTSSLCQVRQEVYTSAVYRWRNYEHLIGDIKEILSNEIKAYESDLLVDASK